LAKKRATPASTTSPPAHTTDAVPQHESLIEGRIMDGGRGYYHVDSAAGPLLCTLRGRLRKDLTYAQSQSVRRGARQASVKQKDPVAIGDRVRVQPTGGGTGIIAEVVARSDAAFTRRDPMHGELTSVAGVDQLIVVFAARDPSPHVRMLDRFLVIAEAQGIPAMICINKVDRGIESWLEERLRVYEQIGYPVLRTSAATGDGVDALRSRLGGHTSALLGPSGVGKSSLLNALQPGLALRVGEVGATTHKGRHTTTGTRLIPLDLPDGGYIADTAGIRALGLARVYTDQLDHYFPELGPFLGGCHLSDCTHLHEPHCAVRTAVTMGLIDGQRYDSYGRLRAARSVPLDDEQDD
jgi:ribosome biogenesis GTPase